MVQVWHMYWKNLEPNLVRQRLVIEGTCDHIPREDEIKDYLEKLSHVVGMKALGKPFAYIAEDKGWGGWIHWVTSGAHFYSYTTNPPFFSVDAYTCKPFDVQKAVEFTREYFKATEIVWKEVEV